MTVKDFIHDLITCISNILSYSTLLHPIFFVIRTSSPSFLLSSSTPPAVCHDRLPNSQRSPHASHPSPSLSLSSPNAHSSPQRGLKGLAGSPGLHRDTDSTDLSSLLLGNGNLEHSLLEAVESLESLNLRGQGGLPPLLPEKRRGGEGGELGSRSPSLSGFSSPHSSSSLSIQFSSPMTPDPLRGGSGAWSPGAGRCDYYQFGTHTHICNIYVNIVSIYFQCVGT